MKMPIKEKDLEPAKNKAIAFSFVALAVALLSVGLSTFQNDFTLKWICLIMGIVFLLLGAFLIIRLNKKIYHPKAQSRKG